jgi:hypothetical protein
MSATCSATLLRLWPIGPQAQINPRPTASTLLALRSEVFQYAELLMIFFVQATADIESRALLALIVISLQLALESPCCANGRSHFITTCML